MGSGNDTVFPWWDYKLSKNIVTVTPVEVFWLPDKAVSPSWVHQNPFSLQPGYLCAKPLLSADSPHRSVLQFTGLGWSCGHNSPSTVCQVWWGLGSHSNWVRIKWTVCFSTWALFWCYYWDNWGLCFSRRAQSIFVMIRLNSEHTSIREYSSTT